MTVDQMVEATTDKMVQTVFEDNGNRESIKSLWDAVCELIKVREALALASAMVADTPDEMRIGSLYDDVDKISLEIYKQIVRMGGR